MNTMLLSQRAQEWIAQAAMPLWLSHGVDWERGGFFESLSTAGEAVTGPKRAMVQARQIYCARMAMELGACDRATALRAASHGIQFLTKRYTLHNGGFIHSTDCDGEPLDLTPDLYAQAFALFGQAHAYALEPRVELRERALALVRYLRTERRTAGGGFTEIHEGQILYRANPLMHLLEAAVTWMETDPDPTWRELADELVTLCRSKLIDRESGMLAENFDEFWAPLRTDGRFVFEPGHQYEWIWLLGRYEKLTGVSLSTVRTGLFARSEKYGVCPRRKCVHDEVWNDFTPKSRGSRFWTQCERIKAALQLGAEAPRAQRESYTRAADEALTTLFLFLETPTPGLWFDAWTEEGEFKNQPARASALYHIVGALSEYLKIRPGLA
jgi:mannose/cellobiose epimerase-like protein (N-acyl-D-glucosamine 2-epimerase family)